MVVKKMYVELVELLEANQNEKVKSILPEVIAMVSAKQTRNIGSTFIKNSNGEAIAIHCYYFKRWMPLVGNESVEFGAKKSTTTGYNTMCKEGVSNWTKQNNGAKKAHDALLDRLEAGDLTTDQISEEKARIEKARCEIVETELGFAERDEVIAYLTDNGVSIAE